MDTVTRSLDKLEISTLELLENAKRNLNINDLKSTIFFINLTKFSSNFDISAKVNAFSLLSIVLAKIKKEEQLEKIGRKIMKYIDAVDLKTIHYEILTSIVRILLKASQLSEECEKNLLSCWFLYIARTIQDDHSLKSADIQDMIKQYTARVMKKIAESSTIAKFELKDKRANLKRLGEQITKYISAPVTIDNEGESYFVVSSRWLNHMQLFVRSLNSDNLKAGLERIFKEGNMCLWYFSKAEDEEEMKELHGVYSGPINNFLFTTGTDSWEDPADAFTNSYIIENLRERVDFYYFPRDLYSQIKFYFTTLFEIERKSIRTDDGNFEIELDLNKISVIFLNEFLRENFKDQIKPKKIQISKHDTLSQLTVKLRRVFQHLLVTQSKSNLSETDFDYEIYKSEKNERETFDMILSYVNRNKSHRINAVDLINSFDKNTKIKDLAISNKSLLVVEVTLKTSVTGKFIRIISDHANCSVCNFLIDCNRVILCDFCVQTTYCSEVCKKSDQFHVEYHKRIASLYKKKIITGGDLGKATAFTALLDANSRCGLVGLKNLGNTCFMNSAIQCLSHIPDLTQYFLTNAYIEHIGKCKSSEGFIAKSYADLIKELWLGSSPVLSPLDFRQIFVSFVKQFTGFTQQDSQEMISFLLERLHDDLNQVKERPRVNSYEEMIGETDLNASQRLWKAHTAKNNSILVDLFHGQFKSKITCPNCNKISITFDPFIFLPLAVPDRSSDMKAKFKVFPNNYCSQYFTIECHDLNKRTRAKDLKKKMKGHPVYAASDFDVVLYRNQELISVLDDDVVIFDYVFTPVDFSEEEFNEYEITLYEVKESSSTGKNLGEYVNFFISPCEIYNESYYYFFSSKKPRSLTYCHAFSMHKTSTLKDLYIEVFKYYRRAMDDMLTYDNEGQADASYYSDFYEKLNDSHFIEQEFHKCFIKEQAFNLFFLNNIPPSNSWIYGKQACEFCHSSKCTFCRISFDLSTPIYHLIAIQSLPRELLLIADFTKYSQNFSRFYSEFPEIEDNKNYFRGDTTIYDCLNSFQQEEKLTRDNAWNCPKCRKNVEALKKMDIYNCPKYVIFQFKRFKNKEINDMFDMVLNKKNETFIDFPIEGLDMRKYIIGPNNADSIYDLLAVNQHFGSLKLGHYVSLCKNKEEWWEFNDDVVKKVEDVSAIINENAYLLFYRRRDGKNSYDGEKNDMTMMNTTVNSSSIMGEMKDI